MVGQLLIKKGNFPSILVLVQGEEQRLHGKDQTDISSHARSNRGVREREGGRDSLSTFSKLSQILIVQYCQNQLLVLIKVLNHKE